MDQLAIRRRGKGRPRTRPGAALGDKGVLLRRQPHLPAQARYQGGHPGQARPEETPPRPWQPWRPAACLRRRTVQGPQHRRNAALASSSSSGRSRPAMTSASSCTGHRRSGVNPDLATRSSPMIHGTRSSRPSFAARRSRSSTRSPAPGQRPPQAAVQAGHRGWSSGRCCSRRSPSFVG